MDEERNGWGIFTYDDGPIHISPVNEDHIHYPECSCRPVQNEDGFWIHNSFDGREKYETGERKAN